MQVVRRVYLYLVSFIGLWMVLSGAASLLRLLLESALGTSDNGFSDSSYLRNQFSLSGAVLVVGGIVWAVHWFIAQRTASSADPDADDERRSVLRKIFLYGVMAATLWQVAFAASAILSVLLSPFLSRDRTDIGSTVSSSFPQLIIYGIAGLYYWYILRLDNQASSEEGRPATIRRWYLFLVSYASLTALMSNLASLAYFLWQFATNADQPWSSNGYWIPPPVATAVPWIIVSGAIWLLHWNIAQSQMAASDQESRSTLRKVYLFAITLQMVVVTLGALAILLNSILRLFWGSDPAGGTGEPILTAAGRPLTLALVYGAFWIYHRLVIRWDAALAVSQPSSQLAIRQLYRYMVALIGLGFLAAGVANLLRLLIDQLLGGADVVTMDGRAWGDQLSFVATTIIVGTVTWLASWLPSQREALAPGGESARYSLPRRLYLILVLFFSVTSLLSGAAWLLYQLLRFVGEPLSSWISNASWAFAATLTAGTIFAYHAYILRGDQRARPAPIVPVPAPPAPIRPGTIILLSADDPFALEASVSALRAQLPENIHADLFHAPGVNPQDISAWLSALAPAPTSDQPLAPHPNLPPDPEFSPA